MAYATTGGKALDAGLAVLKEGGSAAYAAIATALCEVAHPGGSYVSWHPLLSLLQCVTVSVWFAGVKACSLAAWL
jgi:hypothetical protein